MPFRIPLGNFVSFSSYGPHSPIEYGYVRNYDIYNKQYIIENRNKDVVGRFDVEVRDLHQKVNVWTPNADVYVFRGGYRRSHFRAEIFEGEIISSDRLHTGSSSPLAKLVGMPAYHAYLMLYLYYNSTVEIQHDRPPIMRYGS